MQFPPARCILTHTNQNHCSTSNIFSLNFTIPAVIQFMMTFQARCVASFLVLACPCSCFLLLDRYNDYFYGSTKLCLFRGKRGIVSTTKWAHSLLLFRGKIYEWGSDDYPWPTMGRSPSSCDINWRFYRIGTSKCTKSDIDKWNDAYKRSFPYKILWSKRYGYNFLFNNCHHYVNRLAAKLKSNCGR